MSHSAADQIVDMRRLGMRFGTERTRKLLDLLNSPDKKLKIVHVAGTNGKGSVCAYITSILLAAGKSVGTYTTPEVFSFEEQFAVNGVPLKNCEDYLARVQLVADGMEDKPTAYERQTAAAFLMFAEEGCEYAVIECCMGGLLDTTNAAEDKALAVITSISLEHTEYLGGTLESIARHKAGIIKGCPAVISQCVPEEVRGIFYELGARLADAPSDICEGEDGTYFTCAGTRYFTKLAGCRQPYNAATAIAAAKVLGIGGDAIACGIESARISGRLQLIAAGGKKFILDGAHNPESFIPLEELLKGRYSGMRRTLIYGCLSDKDITSALSRLAGCAGQVIAVQPKSYRAMGFDKIISECRRAFGHAEGAADVRAALDMAKGDIVAVCGTFTILKEARDWIEKEQ